MDSVGSLAVSARFAAGRLADVAVRLERPPVARFFVGQSPAAVRKRVPLLYSLCARAQEAAAAAALAAAADEPLPAAEATALWAEMLHEQLWRLLLDWPPALGLAPAKEAFVAWRAARAGSGLAAASAAVVRDFLQGGLAEQCRARLPGSGEGAVFDPPALTPADWLAYWRSESEAPPAASPPASVAAAWQARVHEALRAAQAVQDGRPYPLAAAGGAGWGIGQAPTARGVLTHALRLHDGKVSAYRIWAPTDRHFADASALAALLAGGRWPDAAAAQPAVERAVLALDPCLPYTVKVNDA